MTTATAPDLTLPLIGGRHHFLLRRLHSLTGIAFSGYLLVHLLVNAALIQGVNPDMYQTQVDKIHSLPFLWGIEWALIFLPILFHTFYGIWITFTAQPNVEKYPFFKNWFYMIQRGSALVIVLFLAFHVFGMRGWLKWAGVPAFETHHATITTARHIRAGAFLLWFVYPVGILASAFHLANGLWTAAITWGLTITAAAQRRWGGVCVGIFAVALLCGILALAGALRVAL